MLIIVLIFFNLFIISIITLIMTIFLLLQYACVRIPDCMHALRLACDLFYFLFMFFNYYLFPPVSPEFCA